MRLALVIAMACGPGCSERRAAASGFAGAVRDSGTPHGTVPRAFVFAAPDTIRLTPEQPPSVPTVDYPSLEAARDTVEAIVLRGIAPGDTAVHVSRQTARFQYQYAPDTTTALAIHVVVTDTSSCPVEYVENALAAAGWAPAYGYSADGPDGTRMSYVTARFLCVIDGAWDGGDDSDSTYVPAPGCEVTVTCVPRRKDDEPPK